MLDNQILYTIIQDMKEIMDENCSVWDTNGKCIAATCSDTEIAEKEVFKFLQIFNDRDFQIGKQASCFAVRDDGKEICVLAVHSADPQMKLMGRLCANQLKNANHIYERRLDRNRFFQQLLLDNMLMVDILNQAQKMNVDIEAKRVVFVVEPKKEGDNIILETLKSMYKKKDYVTSIDEGHIILIKALGSKDGYKEVESIARTIVDTLEAEAFVQTRVAYGSMIEELKDVSKCYKEACMALDVGKIFYVEKNVLAYNELGIGRLIHQLPYSLCDMFLKEVFRGNAKEHIDKDTLLTVNTFFENNLNISETARKMYLHRNTLGYRLEKILKTTGLDVRKFDDALTFKIALMVSDHMKYMQTQD